MRCRRPNEGIDVLPGRRALHARDARRGRPVSRTDGPARDDATWRYRRMRGAEDSTLRTSRAPATGGVREPMRSRLLAHLARKPPGYNLTIGRVLAIYLGLMVTLLLAALDQTIVATALPRIVTDLGGITQFSWVFTAYMLTSTVTEPLYGRPWCVLGRRPLRLVSISLFLVGSALCGLAQGMTELIVFRAIQGLGAGGLFPLSLAVVGAIVPPRDRGRWQGLIGAVFAAASILGPAVGGFIVDNWSWRWIFLVNLPVGGAAPVAVA